MPLAMFSRFIQQMKLTTPSPNLDTSKAYSKVAHREMSEQALRLSTQIKTLLEGGA
jgi:hypothetical protein